MKIDNLMLDKIKQMNLLCNLGCNYKDVDYFTIVKNRDEFQKYYTSIEWENFSLDMRNNFTSYLSRHHVNEYSKWNEYAFGSKAFFNTFILPNLLELNLEKYDKKILIDCIRWDLLQIIMYKTYSKYYKDIFFEELIKVYESGHFPCGWDGKFPKGKMIIF